MFSLIGTLASIVLVAVLAIVSITYAGSNWTEGREKSQAATIINQGEQLRAASSMYANQHGGRYTDSISMLIDEGFLSMSPAPTRNFYGQWETHGDYFVVRTDDEHICLKVAQYALGTNNPVIPSTMDGQFGCMADPLDAPGTYTVFYKK